MKHRCLDYNEFVGATMHVCKLQQEDKLLEAFRVRAPVLLCLQTASCELSLAWLWCALCVLSFHFTHKLQWLAAYAADHPVSCAHLFMVSSSAFLACDLLHLSAAAGV